MSEVQTVEMSWRLARRGHDVTVYAPIPEGTEPNWRNTVWKKEEEIDWAAPGVWFLYRDPTLFDHFPKNHPGQTLISISQDEYYEFNDEQIEKLDYLFCFCEAHAKNYVYHKPSLLPKIKLTSNGLDMDLIREIESEGVPERNIYRITYASSPDRGLVKPLGSLLDIFKRAKEHIPQLELHIFYGFNNADKLIEQNPKHFKWLKDVRDRVEKQIEGDKSIIWHGRVPQKEMYQEWFKTGFFIYPTNFRETSCAALMEAQACGAVPIVSPVWALESNTLSGWAVDGDALDSYTKCEFVARIAQLCKDEKIREALRADALRMARYKFNWERQVDAWECVLYGFNENCGSQYNFQHRHVKGRILNVGCDTDFSDLKSRGALNVDLLPESALTKDKVKADIFADARSLPESLYGKFDTVVLGDILEHLSDEDAVRALVSARECLFKLEGVDVESSKIIITVPDDSRPDNEQYMGSKADRYIEGESHFHRPVPLDRVLRWCEEASLAIDRVEFIDYTFAKGWGVLCHAKPFVEVLKRDLNIEIFADAH